MQPRQESPAELQPIDEPAASAVKVLLSAITDFTTEFRAAIERKFSLNGLSFTADIESIDPFDQVTDVEIRIILCGCAGSATVPFIGEAAFQLLVKQQIRRLEAPSLKCCQVVHEVILTLGELLQEMPVFGRYPDLRARFHTTVVTFLEKAMERTTTLVSDLVAMQTYYINARHPDFIGSDKATAILRERMNLAVEQKENPGFFASFFGIRGNAGTTPPRKTAPPTPHPQTADTEITKLLLRSYFALVQRDLADLVPKAIALGLVRHAAEELPCELLKELYDLEPGRMDALLVREESESDEVGPGARRTEGSYEDGGGGQ
ncbi:Dynamin central region-domain-containing protein [Mycena latifolia]|nr:Dynamin central region-domain-containing protein [Mycena latifolia]